MSQKKNLQKIMKFFFRSQDQCYKQNEMPRKSTNTELFSQTKGRYIAILKKNEKLTNIIKNECKTIKILRPEWGITFIQTNDHCIVIRCSTLQDAIDFRELLLGFVPIPKNWTGYYSTSRLRAA